MNLFVIILIGIISIIVIGGFIYLVSNEKDKDDKNKLD